IAHDLESHLGMTSSFRAPRVTLAGTIQQKHTPALSTIETRDRPASRLSEAKGGEGQH
ncbi:hypothetical protein THAOC_19058, partial [Thalassiosira oceanica]